MPSDPTPPTIDAPERREAIERVRVVAGGATIHSVYGKEWTFDPARQFRADLQELLAASSGERGAALRMVEAVQVVLLWRVGELPDKGYIRDNNSSRRAIGETVKALTELRAALATPATVEEPKV